MQLSKELLIEIAGELDMKMKCFLNKHTLEIVSYPDELLLGDFDEEVWEEAISKVESGEEDYIEIRRMNSRDSFQVMESFLSTIHDEKVGETLRSALEGKKPFNHFNYYIHNMPEQFKQAWFSFKQDRMIDFLQMQLNDVNF